MTDKEQVVEKELYPWHDRQGTSGEKNCILDMIDKEQVVKKELYPRHNRQGTSGEKRTVSLTW